MAKQENARDIVRKITAVHLVLGWAWAIASGAAFFFRENAVPAWLVACTATFMALFQVAVLVILRLDDRSFLSFGKAACRNVLVRLTGTARSAELSGINEGRFRSLYEHSMDATFVAKPDGAIISANPAACELFGRTEEELRRIGRKGILDESDPAFIEMIETRQRTGQARAEVRARGADGREFIADVSSVIFRNEHGEERTGIFLRDTTERRRAEERLRTSERLMQMMSRLARVGGWDTDLAADCVLWSDEVCRIHGVPSGTSHSLEEAIAYYPPEYRGRLEAAFNACARDGIPYDEELQIIDAAGRRVWVRSIGQAVRDASGAITRVQGAFQDISEKKQAEHHLFQSQQRFREFADAMPLIVWTAEPDGSVDYANRAFSRYTGFSEDASPKDCWLDAVHPEDRERCLAAWQESVRAERSYSVEFRIQRPGSRTDRWHLVRATPIRDDTGRVVKWYGTAIDIHSSKRAEKVIRRLADSLRTTLESITDAFITLDPDWRFTYINGQAERLLQRRRAELVGKSVWKEFSEAVGGVFDHEFRRAVADGRTVDFEAFFSSLETWVDVRAYPSRQGLAIYLRDITERKRLATERESLEEQLRQSQRLDAIGQLTGGVAHDFNNLLTVILGGADLLVTQLGNDAHLRELAEIIRSSAERGSELTHRLLAFGRRQALAPRAVNVNQLVSGMDGLLRRTLSENIRLDVTNAAGLWSAFVDSAELEAALLNLCINARDAMEGRGRLVIETTNVALDDPDHAAVHSGLKPGEYVLLSVSDTGEGIAPEIRERVFDPFFTTKEKGKGTGLGLSMVYGFVKQSHGHIDIESEVGHGTTVRIYLPRAEEEAVAVEKRFDGGATLYGFEKVLVVEDDPHVRQHARKILRDLGYHVVTANNGREALEVLRNISDVNLLFTDVILPNGMNGRELVEAALDLRPGLRVLYTSGYTENIDIHPEGCAMQFLQKPYRRSDVALKVREVLSASRIKRIQVGAMHE
ncbi:MAG TPA: PAS domain S-box protein [Gammaproteobacteria bacterium]